MSAPPMEKASTMFVYFNLMFARPREILHIIITEVAEVTICDVQTNKHKLQPIIIAGLYKCRSTKWCPYCMHVSPRILITSFP